MKIKETIILIEKLFCFATIARGRSCTRTSWYVCYMDHVNFLKIKTKGNVRSENKDKKLKLGNQTLPNRPPQRVNKVYIMLYYVLPVQVLLPTADHV